MKTQIHLILVSALLVAAGCSSTPVATESNATPEPAVAADTKPDRVDFGADPAASAEPWTRTVGLFGELDHVDTVATSADGDLNLSQVTFAGEGSDGDPDIDPKGQFLVYSSTMHRDHADIYRKEVLGKTVTQLTSDPADDIMPAISPDGTRIAFASNRAGDWNIYVMPVNGGQATQVTSDPEAELHPSWSPDGLSLVYCKSGSQSQRWEIWVTRLEQPGVRNFVDYGLFPKWSPDPASSKILFQRARQRGSRFHGVWTIDYVNGEGMNPTEIVSAKNAAVMHPAWSPDGRHIAFVTVLDPDRNLDAPEQSDVWMINLDGSGRTALTSGQHLNIKPIWGVDGRVYFASNRGGIENIWAVTVNGMNPAPAPTPTNDSAKIAAMSEMDESENSSADSH